MAKEEKKDPYKVLGLEAGVGFEAIAKRYRELARKYHPDLNPGREKEVKVQFSEATDAWHELSEIFRKAGKPFPALDPLDPKFQQKFEAMVSDFLNAPPKDDEAFDLSDDPAPAAKPAAGTSGLPEFEADKWVAVGRKSTALAILGDQASQLKLEGPKRSTLSQKLGGIESITPTQVAELIQRRPNAMAALKIVQVLMPECALYDALLLKAKPPGNASEATALVIQGVENIDHLAVQKALRNPAASIEAAYQNAAKLAPHIQFADGAIEPGMIRFALQFLAEDLIEKFPATGSGRPGNDGRGGVARR